MLEGVPRELGGEIDARQILGLVARGEFVVRALMDSTPFRTFENGGQKYLLQGEEIHTGDCTIISGTLAFDCVRWKRRLK
jgi:hypothetical protein